MELTIAIPAAEVPALSRWNAYFGVQFGPGPVPALTPGDTTFVDTLQTVYAAMATALNTWTMYVEYADWQDHDAREYAAAGPPVVYPGPDGEVDQNNPNSFQATWADVRNNINRGTHPPERGVSSGASP